MIVSHFPEGTQREGQNRELTSHPLLLSRPRKLYLDPAVKERFPQEGWGEKPVSGRVVAGAIEERVKTRNRAACFWSLDLRFQVDHVRLTSITEGSIR